MNYKIFFITNKKKLSIKSKTIVFKVQKKILKILILIINLNKLIAKNR